MSIEPIPITFVFVVGNDKKLESLITAAAAVGLATLTAASLEEAIQVADRTKGNLVLVATQGMNNLTHDLKKETISQPRRHPIVLIESVGYSSVTATTKAKHSNFAEVLIYFHRYFAREENTTPAKPNSSEIPPGNHKDIAISTIDDNNQAPEIQSLDFLKGVSHEVRSFLNGISGPMQLLKDKIEAKDQFDLYTMIDRSISRLVRFTFKTSLVSLIQENKYKVKQENVELSTIIQHALLELNDLKFSDTIKANVEKRSINIPLEGDADLLIQCFEAIIERIVLNYGNSTELKISLQPKDTGEIICKFNFPFEGILDDHQTISSQLESDFKVDLGFVLVRLILDLHNATLSHELLANDEVELKIIFKQSAHE